MTRRCGWAVLTVGAGLMVLSLAGCGERPFADYGLVDPWTRRGWVDDERFGPTYHTKRQDLKKLRSTVARQSPDEQERSALDLAQRLKDETHPVLRSDLIRTLAAIPSPTATEALQQAMNDADADVRVVVCEAWGKRGGEDARQALAQILGSDTDPDVRMAAVRELGKFKDDPQAMQALKLALDDNNPAMQFRAVQSLKYMSGRDYGTDMIAWRDYIDGGNPEQPPPPSIADRLMNWYR